MEMVLFGYWVPSLWRWGGVGGIHRSVSRAQNHPQGFSPCPSPRCVWSLFALNIFCWKICTRSYNIFLLRDKQNNSEGKKAKVKVTSNDLYRVPQRQPLRSLLCSSRTFPVHSDSWRRRPTYIYLYFVHFCWCCLHIVLHARFFYSNSTYT